MVQLTGRKPCFYKGDIVYGYLRPYLNKVWIAEFDGLCSVDQYVYEVAKDFVDVEFVAWFMRSSTYLERAPIDTTPGQLPRIRTEEVASVELNLPPLREQQHIAAVLNEQLASTNQLCQNLEKQLVAINILPTTLLRQAFNGEL
jgi:type I restriction enzyme S subunit